MTARSVAAALAALLAATSAGAAQDAMAPDGWRFQITPYGWAAGMSGDVRPAAGLPTFRADLSFSEILEDLDGAVFVNGTARRDRFVFLGDFTWAAVSRSERLSFESLPVRVSGEVQQTSLTLAAGYSVVQQPGVVVDLLAGARGWHVDASVRAATDIPEFPRFRGGDTEAWVDPIVAARARVDLAPDWSVIGYVDVGGFGAGSDMTWQAVATVNYRFSERLYLSAGYRHLSFDYDRRGTKLDIDMGGPLFGATLRY